MIITTPEDIERIKIYSNIVDEYNSKIREIKHAIITRLESAFVYGIGFDNIERLDVEDDCVESYFNVGKLYFRKEDLMRDQEDIYNAFMNSDDQFNSFLVDGDLICISVKIKLCCESTLPKVYVNFEFDTLVGLVFSFTVNYSDKCDEVQFIGTCDKLCSSDKIKDFIFWFYEHDVFKL